MAHVWGQERNLLAQFLVDQRELSVEEHENVNCLLVEGALDGLKQGEDTGWVKEDLQGPSQLCDSVLLLGPPASPQLP